MRSLRWLANLLERSGNRDEIVEKSTVFSAFPSSQLIKDFGSGVGCFTADVIDTFVLPADDILFDRFGCLRALEFPTA